MKYVRTKDEICEIVHDYGSSCAVKSKTAIDHFTIKWGLAYSPRADEIEKLCDRFVMFFGGHRKRVTVLSTLDTARLYQKRDKRYNGNCVEKVYGAIWTDKGLIYVAKMNDSGVLELL